MTIDYQRKSPKGAKLEADANVWGELIKLNSDSSQVIQIHRQKGRAFGFFVARGTVNNIKGKEHLMQTSSMTALYSKAYSFRG